MKRLMLLMVMSWVLNANAMQNDLQPKLDFRAVAKHLGFDIEKLRIEQNKSGSELLASQPFDLGWKMIRMNKDGQFKISSCAFDDGDIKNNYCNPDWMTLNEALVYEPDMSPRLLFTQIMDRVKTVAFRQSIEKNDH